MKVLNKLLILSAALIGLYGLTNGTAISRADEKRAPESEVECIVREGTNIQGQHYIMPGVIDEHGRCIELQGTASKVIHEEGLYGGLKAVGVVMESELLEDYTVRIEDQNGDGRIDRYSIINKSGDRVYEMFKDLETGEVYSRSTLPGKVIEDKELKREDPTALDSNNDILRNPEKHGFEITDIFFLN